MDNNSKLDQLGLKPHFYYESFPDGGRKTICLLVKDNKLVARGLALCSPLDQFDKHKGRALSCGRAIQAVEHKQDMLFTQARTFFYGMSDVLFSNVGQFKARYMPEFTKRER